MIKIIQLKYVGLKLHKCDFWETKNPIKQKIIFTLLHPSHLKNLTFQQRDWSLSIEWEYR